MASCNKCDNFDDLEIDNIAESDEHEQQLLNSPDYQPDLYYYWHGDIEEDYDMGDYDCLCECCFESNWHEVELIKRRKNKHDDTIIWESNMTMY